MVQAWYQGGISVFDWTDATMPVEIAYHDRGPMELGGSMGGPWSVYWYNGVLVSSEIGRGLDVLELTPSELISQNEIEAARTVRLDYLNAQGQPQFVWPNSFALARAYVDQLERSGGLTAEGIATARGDLAAAEGAPVTARRQTLTDLADGLGGRLGESEKRRVAYHESGHALVAAHCEHADPVQKISIVPRGRAALGYTLQLPVEEQYLRTRAELVDRLKVMVGGRASEELFLGELSTGAHDDLQQATGLARHMVGMFGMSARLGLATCARPSENRFLGGDGALQRDCSEATAREIDEEVKLLLDAAYADAKAILEEHREQLETLVRTLLERETMDQAAFMQVIESSGARANGRERARRGG
jgi:hypothetical protein